LLIIWRSSSAGSPFDPQQGLQDFAAELLAVNPNDVGVEIAAAQGRIALCTATELVAAVTF
jgi:hypothetical protein